MRQTRFTCTWAIALVSSLAGCATTGTVGGTRGGFDGVYRGAGLLDMTISTPSTRTLPREETNAFVALASAGNGRMAANIRFNANGNQCTLVGTQSGAEFNIDPGQLCRGFLGYSRFDVDATLRVSEGRGAAAGGSIQFSLAGYVDAEHTDGSRNLGTARWVMTGSQ